MSLKRMLGLDTHPERYAYGVDPVAGYVSEQRSADRWVATTCGYCSVGCGMLVGVKEGRAVAVRGNPDHPVNHGLLCPKGLSEHHTLDASNRARYPLLRHQGKLGRVTWDEALSTMAAEVPWGAGALRSECRRRCRHRTARHRRVLHARQARAAWAGHAPTTTATRRCACRQRWLGTSGRSAATVPRARTTISTVRTSFC